MSKFQSICTLGMLVCALSGAWAQDTSTPPAEPAPESSQQRLRLRMARIMRPLRSARIRHCQDWICRHSSRMRPR